MKDVWLIRHAESLANVGAVTSTPKEVPLSESGRRQADALPAILRERPDLIIVSPYQRSVQTARPFLELYPDTRTETLNVHEFTYLSIRRCRGTSHSQRKPWVAEYWDRADPAYCDGDQSESFQEFIGRCREFRRRMCGAEFQLAFVFTHEQFIKGLLWDAVHTGGTIDGMAMISFQKFAWSFQVPNASVLRAKIDGDGEFYSGRIDNVSAKNDA